jgi:uncharacterized peroxidase-related enzyme
MPYVQVNPQLPGIVGLLHFRPDTGKLICELVEALLRGPSTLSRGERELIGTFVSSCNGCEFCTSSHAAFAAAQLPEGMALVDDVRANVVSAAVSPKLAALLRIAQATAQGGKKVRPDLVAAAIEAEATDREIHDTVLIAAVFCMCNRYVDGLATLTPQDPSDYTRLADDIVTRGYLSGVGFTESERVDEFGDMKVHS